MTTSTTTAGDLPGITLSVVDGRAALAVAPRELAALASLERMEIAVPGDPSLGPERARLRRGRLQAAVITVDEARLRAALPVAALAAAGVDDLRVGLADGWVRLRGRATVDGRQADFTARALVTPASRRRVRVTIDDVRLYGFLPLPAPLLGGVVLGATVGAGANGRRAAPHWSVEIDVLDLAVYETFAAWGWRVPDISGARLGAVAVSPAGITLAWDADADRPAADAAEITGMGVLRHRSPRPTISSRATIPRGPSRPTAPPRAAPTTPRRGGACSSCCSRAAARSARRPSSSRASRRPRRRTRPRSRSRRRSSPPSAATPASRRARTSTSPPRRPRAARPTTPT